MYLMAKYNQIDKSYYYDYEKLLKHALVISKLNVCAVTRLVKTGSIFLTNAGQIRFFCNGLLDEVFFMDKEEFKQGEYKQC